MDVDCYEKKAGRIHMDVADQPAKIDIAHDALNRGKGLGFRRLVMHPKGEARHNQQQQREHQNAAE